MPVIPLTREEREIVREEGNVSETSTQCLQPKFSGELGSILYCMYDYGHSGLHRDASGQEFDDHASEAVLPRIRENLEWRRAHADELQEVIVE